MIRPAFYYYKYANDEGENEVGIQGATITVTNKDGMEIADGETDEKGYYSLEILPGINTVKVTLPDAYITRAEAMTLINNVLERHVAADGMVEGMATWPDNTPDKWHYIPVQEAANSHYSDTS